MKQLLVGGAATLLVGGAAGVALPVPLAGAEDPACTATACSFSSPNQATDCVITFQAGPANPDSVFCAWSDGERAHTVKMLANGALDPCINPAVNLVDNCKSTPLGVVPALGYGQTAALGPFTCLAEAQAVTCTVAPTGKGFTMNSSGILPVMAPAPPPPPAPASLPASTAVATPTPVPTDVPAPPAAPIQIEPAAPEQPADQ